MFTNKKSIIFITKSKITVSQVTIDNKPNEKIIGQFDWTLDSLDNVLLEIRRIIRDNIRILLSEDFVYVVHIALPPCSIVNKEIVRQKAQEFIPENLTETVWDFKEIAKTVQVVAVVKSLFECLSKSLAKADFRVEAIEPLSYALARFTKQQEKPFLFVYVDTEILLTLAQKEIVFATERLTNISITDINQFLAFTKEKFLIEPKNIVFCGNTKNIDLKQYENPSFKTEIQNISPAISLAYKEDIKGKDEDVLNLELLKLLRPNGRGIFNNASSELKSAEAENVSASRDITTGKFREGGLKILHTEKQNISLPTNAPNNLPNKIPTIVAIGFVVTIGIIGGLIVYKNISSKKTENLKLGQSTTSKPAPTPSLTPLATESSEIDKSDYMISILNGSGISGKATKLETLLKNEGFNVVKTGNAERFDYAKTEVHYKETVPSELILLLDKSLKTLYDLSIGKKLKEKEDTDILIIIGKGSKQ